MVPIIVSIFFVCLFSLNESVPIMASVWPLGIAFFISEKKKDRLTTSIHIFLLGTLPITYRMFLFTLLSFPLVLLLEEQCYLVFVMITGLGSHLSIILDYTRI